MNNTLTGLGLALVLALIAALIGPWFVNWTAYRDDFARQASAVVGAPVRVTGAVDARLLPSPYIRFRGLTVGEGATRSSVDEVEIELSIAALLRGEFRADRVKLVRPRIGVETTADGAVRTAFSTSAKGKTTADRVSFDRAEIADGVIVAKTPGGEFALDRIAGIAEAGSLAGPYRFEGAAGPAGRRVDARLVTTRADAAGTMRVKLSLVRDGQRETLDIDGGLKLDGKPAFDGRFSVARTARPAKSGEPQASREDEPWRIAGDVEAEAGRLAFEKLDIVYGADERSVRLAGRGSIILGATRSVNLALDSRQIDLDRIVGEGRPRTPGGVLQAFASRFAAESAPPVDGRLTLDVRGVVLAGDVVQDVKVELEAKDGGWRVRKAAGRLPGDSALTASGAVAFADGSPGFTGSVDFASTDVAGLRDWLSGGASQGGSLVRRLSVKGELSARPAAVTIEDADLSVDGARSRGRVAWRAAGEGGRARIEAALDADKLDVDALGAERLVAHVLADAETDLALALDARELTFAKVRMSDVSLDGTSDASGFDLRRFAVRDAGGASLTGSGRIARGAGGPEGRVSFLVDAPRLGPLIAIARSAGAPEAALDALERRAEALAPLKLALDLEAGAAGQRLSVDGQAAGGAIEAELSTTMVSPDAQVESQIKITSADGRRLAALVGLDLSLLTEAPGGDIWVRLAGAPARGMTGEARFAALGLDLAMRGALAHAPVTGLSAQGEASLKAQDLVLFAESLGRLTPGVAPRLPASLRGRFQASSDGLRIEDLAGDVAGRPISGRLSLPADQSSPIEGALAFDDLAGAALVALVASPEALGVGDDRRSVWPSAVFGPSPLRGLNGRIDIAAKRVALTPARSAANATFTLAIRPNAVAIENLAADLDGGRLTGSLGVSRLDGDAAASIALAIEHAGAERLLGLSPATAPLSGMVDLLIEAQGTGRSLAGVIGALTGTGRATLTDGMLRGLDVGAIGRVEQQVEAGLPLEAPKIAAALARDIGGADLRLARAVAPFTLSGGVARTSGLASETPEARLGGALALDLRLLMLDADITLRPNLQDAPQIVVSFEGPLSKPVRRLDATSFTGWLSVRAVERETARIEAMEADIRVRARIARQRADDERKREDDDQRRRQTDSRTRLELLLRSEPSVPGTLPATIDVSPPQAPPSARNALTPPGADGRSRSPEHRGPPNAYPAPMSILPPGAPAPLGQ